MNKTENARRSGIIPSLVFLATLAAGMAIGVWGDRLVTHFKAYSNATANIVQGRSILERISEYEKTYGEKPGQDWFVSLGGLTVTREEHHWIYHNPPLNTERGSLVISTATEYRNNYLGGYADGRISFGVFKPLPQQ